MLDSVSPSRMSRLMAWYSTRKGFLNPLSFGSRMCSGIWPPSKFIGMVSRAPWPFMPRPAVLPRRPAVPRPTRMRSWVDPGAGWRSWTLMGMSALRVFDPDEMRDLGQHPPDLGSVGQGVRLADAAEAE